MHPSPVPKSKRSRPKSKRCRAIFAVGNAPIFGSVVDARVCTL